MTEWQLIETCDPYKWMILGHKDKKWVRFGRKWKPMPYWYYSTTNEHSQYAQVKGDEPTHWMPMMEPPK